MIPSWAKPGVKIVCVEAIFDESYLIAFKFPVVKETYTIRAIAVFPDGVGFHLDEIRNPIVLTDKGILEPYFGAVAFRPIVSLESDLEAHFTRLLDVKTPIASERVDG
jgi:hypothetical protein